MSRSTSDPRADTRSGPDAPDAAPGGARPAAADSPSRRPPAPDPEAVEAYLRQLQDRICGEIETLDGGGAFREDRWQREAGGGGRTRILTGGAVFEKAGVGFSHVHGAEMPASATEARPELAGRSFRAMGVSLVFHPESPYVPTTHANVRFFLAEKADAPAVWWFGGGFDLTPYYPFAEDAVHWHRTARDACAPFGDAVHPHFKAWCDRYFFLPHRNEARGIGGLFFDDLNRSSEVGGGDFAHCFALMRSVGDHFLPAYRPLVERRRGMTWGDGERRFQLYRRGRYVEFNLLYDRGTRFGLHSGGRTESILMSLPPLVRWDYGYEPPPDSPEERLTREFLVPRDWLAGGGEGA